MVFCGGYTNPIRLLALDHEIGDDILDFVLDIPSDGSGSELGIVGFFEDEIESLGVVFECYFELKETFREECKLEDDDLLENGLVNRIKDDDTIDTVQELRREKFVESTDHLFFDLLVIPDDFFLFVIGHIESDLRSLIGEFFAPDIGGHDDDGIFEIDFASFSVRKGSIFEYLEEEIEDLETSFFDLIEEDDGIWFASNPFGEHSSFLISDISGSRSDEFGSTRSFVILGHIEFDEGFVIPEKFSCELFHELSLPDSGRSEEEEAPDRTIAITDPDPIAFDRADNRGNSFILTDDMLSEGTVEIFEFLHVLDLDIFRWDSRDALDNSLDVISGDMETFLSRDNLFRLFITDFLFDFVLFFFDFDRLVVLSS